MLSFVFMEWWNFKNNDLCLNEEKIAGKDEKIFNLKCKSALKHCVSQKNKNDDDDT